MSDDPAVDLAEMLSGKIGMIVPDDLGVIAITMSQDTADEYNRLLALHKKQREKNREIVFDELPTKQKTKQLYPKSMTTKEREETIDSEIRLSRKAMATIIEWVVHAHPEIPPAIQQAVTTYHRQMKPINKAL